jgi:hypothetical protein
MNIYPASVPSFGRDGSQTATQQARFRLGQAVLDAPVEPGSSNLAGSPFIVEAAGRSYMVRASRNGDACIVSLTPMTGERTGDVIYTILGRPGNAVQVEASVPTGSFPYPNAEVEALQNITNQFQCG